MKNRPVYNNNQAIDGRGCKARINFPGITASVVCNRPATHLYVQKLTVDNINEEITPLCLHCYSVANNNGLYAKFTPKHKSSWSQKSKKGIKKYQT